MRPSDLVCFSHLRWNHVRQRPHHLMSEAAAKRRVFYVEEPIVADGPARLDVADGRVTVVRPIIPESPAADGVIPELLAGFAREQRIELPWLWFETPMMLPWAARLDAGSVVYDCMDELAAFRLAPASIAQLEARLLDVADVVFTGGTALFEAKRGLHRNVHAVPSSVDVDHFRRAREQQTEPPDQAALRRPRIGFFGVVDERLDAALVSTIAARRRDWEFVLVGPSAKVADAELPTGPNVHLLGARTYDELPAYLAGWDVAMIPFARNEATRYISPTKTPEYLAGGRPVVSTSIRDVAEPYGRLGLVRIADDPDAFVAAIEAALDDDVERLRARADVFLHGRSWQATWRRMEAEVRYAAARRRWTAQPAPLLSGAAG